MLNFLKTPILVDHQFASSQVLLSAWRLFFGWDSSPSKASKPRQNPPVRGGSAYSGGGLFTSQCYQPPAPQSEVLVGPAVQSYPLDGGYRGGNFNGGRLPVLNRGPRPPPQDREDKERTCYRACQVPCTGVCEDYDGEDELRLGPAEMRQDGAVRVPLRRANPGRV